MNYILNRINQRIEFLAMNSESELIVHYQSRLEYMITLMLGYLWNKNYDKLDVNEKESVFSEVILPSIGSVVNVCKSLDIEKEFFGNKKLQNLMLQYPNIRNRFLGHGFSYEDKVKELSERFTQLYNDILASKTTLFSDNFDFIVVCGFDGVTYRGLRLPPSGDSQLWSCPKEVKEFLIDNIYIYDDKNSYHRVSPFIHINKYADEFYTFNCISEKLTGRIHYNRLITTSVLDKEWEEFAHLTIANDGIKVLTANGTIRNIYDNNYNHYIDVGIRVEIQNFLERSKSSVCATLWGHGGIGKTATIQKVCDYFANKSNKTFDYIIFISAKDRKYNYYKGCIETIDAEITTYHDVITRLNRIIFDKVSNDVEDILNYAGKLLLVIDDYESFAKEEAEKLTDFIKKMDINHHKVVITTRAASYTFGQEIKANELNVDKTFDFLSSIIKSENYHLSEIDKVKLNEANIKCQIHNITSGRPLFIFQLAVLIAQRGLSEALIQDVKSGENAIQFLYGRLYGYLSEAAQDLFVVLGMLVTKDDMTNVLDKAKYILNMESREDIFISSVEELKKLKIIKVSDDEGKFFEIYSKEILDIMTKQLSLREASIVGNYKSRLLQINRDKNVNIDQSLLTSANANRLAKSEQEVTDSYKQILNRANCNVSIKLQAAINLTSYLILDKGKRPDALDYFDKYSHLFVCKDKKNKEGRRNYAQYVLQWTYTLWGNGNDEEKKKAVDILSDYYKDGTDYGSSHDLKIAATLLMYRSLMVVTEWRSLRNQIYFKEITYAEYQTKRSAQIKECKDIHGKIGLPLFNHITQKSLVVKKGEAAQYIFTAFYNYIDVLIRIKEEKFAVSICEQVVSIGPIHFKNQFETKKEWILSFGKKESC